MREAGLFARIGDALLAQYGADKLAEMGGGLSPAELAPLAIQQELDGEAAGLGDMLIQVAMNPKALDGPADAQAVVSPVITARPRPAMVLV